MSDANKARALAALAESSTLTEASQRARISRKSLYNYLNTDPEFAAAYSKILQRMTLDRLEALAHEQTRARQTVVALMEDENQTGAVRLNAAKVVLEAAATAQARAEEAINRTILANASPLDGWKI